MQSPQATTLCPIYVLLLKAGAAAVTAVYLNEYDWITLELFRKFIPFHDVLWKNKVRGKRNYYDLPTQACPIIMGHCNRKDAELAEILHEHQVATGCVDL
jgi:hypothetical protein